MEIAAALGLLAVLLFGPAALALERARWPSRAPRAAIALWQALGLAGAVAALGAGLALAVAPLAVGPLPGVVELTRELLRGHPAHTVGFDEAFGLTLSADVFAVLAAGLIMTVGRTIGARRRHRQLLDLVCRASVDVPGTVLLDDPRAAAYCLPGLRPRIVVSAGALALLDGPELRAVVAHERGHAHERHDLVMLPFASMVDMLRWMPYVRCAPGAVAGLLEMAADDFAARRHRPEVLAAALLEMASAGVAPSCAFAAATLGVSSRVERLLGDDRRSRAAAGLAGAAAAGLVVLPVAALVIH